MADDQSGLHFIENDSELSSTEEAKPFRFKIRDLIVLTALVAMVLAIPIPDLLLAMFAAGMVAISCVGVLSVYLFPRIQKLTSAEDVLIRLALYVLAICLAAIVLCGLALFLRTYFAADPTQTMDEMFRATGQF